MTADRHELHELVDELPEDQVAVVLADVRRRLARSAQTAAIKAALGDLDGTDAAAVSLMTGLDADELDDLGGLPR